MRISDSHAHFELFVAANVPTGLVGVIGCRLGGLLVCLVGSELDGACCVAVGC